MGNTPEGDGALSQMAALILRVTSDEAALNHALERCALECTRYAIRLPHILSRIPGHEIPDSEAEMRRAWDVLMAFVSKYVGNDVYGSYGPEHGWFPRSYPKLEQRVLDVVRRSGGWKSYKRMSDEDFPFVQKRFFEEYAAWTAVEQVDPGRLLAQMPRLQLVAKMEPEPAPPVKRDPKQERPAVPVRPVPRELSDAEWEDRRQLARQQAKVAQAIVDRYAAEAKKEAADGPRK